MSLEQEIKGVEKEMRQCSWCGMTDDKIKVYASPGDDLENPRAYHQECFEALKIFVMLLAGETDKSPEQLVKMANQIMEIETGVRRRKKKLQ